MGFTEKIQWLKLNDHKPIYTKFADKYEVREYVKEKIGVKYLVPILGVWDTVNDIDLKSIPNQFVLKCTHNSGGVVVCNDLKNFNHRKSFKFISKEMKRNFFFSSREWPYKNIKPRIICEKYLEPDSNGSLSDYKVFCFNSKPQFIQIISERNSDNYYSDYYNFDWSKFSLNRRNHNNNPNSLVKPKCLKELYDIAKILSADTDFSRIDFFIVDDKIYFGEITLYPLSGYLDFKTQKDDNSLGDLLTLTNLDL